MNKKYVVVAFGLVAVMLIWKLAGSDNQVAVCNSNVATEILHSNLIKNKKEEALRLIRQHTSAQGPSPFEKELSSWSGNVTNIRETSYDAKSNTRDCAAEIQYSPVLAYQTQMTAFGLMLETQPCTALNYKIQNLLDKPGQVYVTWRCLRTLDNTNFK